MGRRTRRHEVRVDERTAHMDADVLECRSSKGGHRLPPFRDMVRLDFQAGTYRLEGKCEVCGTPYVGEWNLSGDVVTRPHYLYDSGYLMGPEWRGTGRLSRGAARLAYLARLFPNEIRG